MSTAQIAKTIQRERAGKTPRGAPWSKVTVEQVRTIRRLYADGFTQTEIAKQFDLSQSGVHRIVTFKCWADV